MDYREFHANQGFLVTVFVESIGISVLISQLFYDTWWGMAVFPVIGLIFWKLNRERWIHNRRRNLKSEFREVMILVSGNLNAGYSLENAFVAVEDNLLKGGQEYPLMKPELIRIANGVACNRRIEDLLLDFGRRCGVPEIHDFAELLRAAKRYGGNIQQLIRQTASNLADISITEMEIDTLVSAKRLEGRIMFIVPFGILAYLRLTNPVYLQVVYETIAGKILMTICLAVIGAMAWWIEKIVRIEV